MANRLKKSVVTLALSAGLTFALGCVTPPDALASENLHDPEAESLLKKMSDYLTGLQSVSADLFVLDEHIMDDGLKLSVVRSASIKMKRPDKLYFSRKGLVVDQEIFFDGSKVVLYGKNLGMAVEIPAKGNVDAAHDATVDFLGSDLPGRDIFTHDVYAPLMEVINESTSLGSVRIGDATCRQLIFRTDEVDVQLWVNEGEQPLPCRYTITEKWTYAAPQYTVTFSNWQVNQAIPDSNFIFAAPAGVNITTKDVFIEALNTEGDTK